MREKLTKTLGKVKTGFLRINKKIRIAIVALLIVAVGVILFLTFKREPKPYVVLFTGLSSEDMSAVQSFLEENAVTEYRVENADTITVPSEIEPSVRALMVQENYPATGFAYERYLNNVGTLSSNSDREILFLYELQDRLGATIRCIEGVQEARVIITQAQDHRYILDSDDVIEASATVMVAMKDGKDLPEDLANSIRAMVETAVQDLHFENITIGDTNGNTFSGELEDETSLEDSSQLKLALEEKVNETLRKNIRQVLEPMFGPDNVKVSVSSLVDITRTYNDETVYEEPEWAQDGSSQGEGIIGSKIYDNRVAMNEDGTVGGVVGTATNADLNEYVERYTPTGAERELKSSGEINYNVDTYHEQRENPGGVVTDVMVAVTVNSEQGDRVDPIALRGLVARAARIDAEYEAEKVSVLIGPFYKEPAPEESPVDTPDEVEPMPLWMFMALFVGIALFVILLTLILLLRKRARILAERHAAEMAEQARLQAEAAAALLAQSHEGGQDQKGADIMDLHSERSMELRMNVRQFAEENPEICAQMIKSWLRGGDEDGG